MNVWVACIGLFVGILGVLLLAVKGKGQKFQKIGITVFGILMAVSACYLLLTLLLLGGIS